MDLESITAMHKYEEVGQPHSLNVIYQINYHQDHGCGVKESDCCFVINLDRTYYICSKFGPKLDKMLVARFLLILQNPNFCDNI